MGAERGLRALVLAALAAVAALAACGGTSDRRADLDATTHRFTPVDDGLVQTVLVRDPTDRRQVGLVRAHLASEADRFAAGDYGDPAQIHGAAMPGLADLEDGAARIEIADAEVPAGARITYATADPALVRALHRWGRAQVADHGSGGSS